MSQFGSYGLNAIVPYPSNPGAGIQVVPPSAGGTNLVSDNTAMDWAGQLNNVIKSFGSVAQTGLQQLQSLGVVSVTRNSPTNTKSTPVGSNWKTWALVGGVVLLGGVALYMVVKK